MTDKPTSIQNDILKEKQLQQLIDLLLTITKSLKVENQNQLKNQCRQRPQKNISPQLSQQIINQQEQKMKEPKENFTKVQKLKSSQKLKKVPFFIQQKHNLKNIDQIKQLTDEIKQLNDQVNQLNVQNSKLLKENQNYQNIQINFTKEKDQLQKQIMVLQSSLYEKDKIINDMKIINEFNNNKQLIEDQECNIQDIVKIKIEELYILSNRNRNVELQYKKFIRQYQEQKEVQKHYNIYQLNIKQQLGQYVNGMIPVRGDGNCFYTAFGYQFLKILLLDYSEQAFSDFINEIENNISFKIFYNNFSIDNQNEEQVCFKQFIKKLRTIRNLNLFIREQKLFDEYSECEQNNEIDGCFYGLSTIFFRNLSKYVMQFSEFKISEVDNQSLLQWEAECNQNELVIAALASYLKIQIIVIIFNEGNFKVNQYNQESQHIITLLFTPGHYNVGIQSNKN